MASKKLRTCSETSIERISTDEDVINRLPTEIIMHIFSFLNLRDRIRIERVCKKWKDINETNPWFFTNKLDLTEPCEEDRCVLRILKKHGRRLRRLSVCFQGCPFGEEILPCCPNLTSVDLTSDDEDSAYETLSKLPELCNRLQRVRLAGAGCGDEVIISLFKNCPIRKLELANMSEIAGDGLTELNKTVRKLRLDSCDNLNSIDPGPNWHLLTHLTISDCIFLSTESIVRILKRVGGSLLHLDLREPNFGGYVPMDWEMIGGGLGYCKNIRCLNLAGSDIARDDILKFVSLSCAHLKNIRFELDVLTRATSVAFGRCVSLEGLHIRVPRRGSRQGTLEKGALTELGKCVSIKNVLFEGHSLGISDVIIYLSRT